MVSCSFLGFVTFVTWLASLARCHQANTQQKRFLEEAMAAVDISCDELILTPQQKAILSSKSDRKLIVEAGDADWLWPEGVILWKIDEDWATFPDDSYRTALLTAMKVIERDSCLEFSEALGDEDYYVNVTHQPGCWSYLGRVPLAFGPIQPQPLSLGEGCQTSVGVVIHELLHAAGFMHEQSRSDRDDHIVLNLDNVPEEMHRNFEKFDFGINYAPYDLNSIMHYRSYDFSMTGKPVLVARKEELTTLMWRSNDEDPLSFYDKVALNRAYLCAKHCPSLELCYNDGFISKECICTCPAGFSGLRCADVDTQNFLTDCTMMFTLDKGDTLMFDSSDYIIPRPPEPLNGDGDPGVSNCAMVFVSQPGTNLELKVLSVGTPFCFLLGREDYIEIRYNLPGQRGVFYYCTAHLLNRVFTSTRNFVTVIFHFRPSGFYRAHMTFQITSKGEPVEIPLGTAESFEEDDFDLKFYHFGDRHWQRDVVMPAPTDARPSSAHTGKYGAFFESSPAVGENERAAIVTRRQFDAREEWCFTFWYYMNADDVADLFVVVYPGYGERDKDPPYSAAYREVWNVSGAQGNDWNLVELEFYSGQFDYDYFHVGFLAVSGNASEGVIAVDDVKMGPCGESPPALGPLLLSEDFEQEDFTLRFDVWKKHRHLHWERIHTITSSSKTGPDSALTGNWYIYFEASHVGTGARAWLVTKQSFSGPVCVKFASHMYGEDMGRLEVRAMDYNEDSELVWEKFGDHGNQWFSEQVDVAADYAFRVAFVAIKGLGYRSDIALDDVAIHEGACPPTSENPVIISENFEHGFKNTNTGLGDLLWMIGESKTRSTGTGPLSSNGKYAYIEASEPNNPHRSGQLRISHEFTMNQKVCLSFLYNMRGDEVMGMLDVIMAVGDDMVELFRIEGDQGPDWHRQKIEIPAQTTVYALYFKAATGRGYRSDICIDDIIVSLCNGDHGNGLAKNKLPRT